MPTASNGSTSRGRSSASAPARRRRPRVMLALEWLDTELNLGVAEFARQAGWIIDDVITHTGRPPTKWTGDGIIALLRHRDSELVRFVRRSRLPVVDLVNELRHFRVPRLLADNRAIGATAAEHLLSCGIEHLAFLNLWNSQVEQERMAGFRDAVVRAGRSFHTIEAWREGRTDPGHDETMDWLRQRMLELPRPLGVMGQHDREAIYLLQACELAGLSVPEQVAVVGSDNDPLLCELGPVPLSSVDNRRRDQGYEAARLLDRLMKGHAPPTEPVRVPAGPVIIRQSSEVLAVPDLDLSKALRYIADHYREPISVQQVVDHVDVARRRLYMLFETHLGRPIHAEILRRRLDHAKRLLVTTDSKLYSVARTCGFPDAQQFTRVFTREVGTPPSRYRQQRGRAFETPQT
ncbi:MAG: substrate-binding domain-containing protein [Tepidisphaeraceae bacterium]